jgi:FKBP-type peptidyl-prolyl cis-trans isomerase
MNLSTTSMLAFVGLLLSCNQEATDGKAADITTEKGKISYVLGMDIAQSLKQMDTEIDLASFTKGVSDQLGGAPMITEEDAFKIKQEFSQKKQQEMIQKRTELAEKNKQEGPAFLEANKAKSGVKVTESGLQYIVITEGKGAKPVDSDRVKVHYKGTLIDGSEFDNSYSRGEPVTLPVQGVVPGWTEALKLMNVGSKYQVFIPSDLGYGERGAGMKIGPHAVLVFEMELIEILASEPAPAAMAPMSPSGKPALNPDMQKLKEMSGKK